MPSSFALMLKDWRHRRKFSQMDLGLAADVSTRHVSFLETGRSSPSRQMVVRLCEILGVPHAERNQCLNAAGFAPLYPSAPNKVPTDGPIGEALSWSLQRHDPYPGLAFDRHWHVLEMNESGARLFGMVGIRNGANLLDEMLDIERMSQLVVNWQEVAHYLSIRLRTESAFLGGDERLDRAARTFAEIAGGYAQNLSEQLPPVVPLTMQLGGTELRLFSMIGQFGTVQDIALADLKMELMYPADAQSRTLLEQLVPDA